MSEVYVIYGALLLCWLAFVISAAWGEVCWLWSHFRAGPDAFGQALGWKLADRVLIPLRVAEIMRASGLPARPASYGLWQAIRPARVADRLEGRVVAWENYRQGLSARLAAQDAEDAAARERARLAYGALHRARWEAWQAFHADPAWLCPECHHGNHGCTPYRCRCDSPRW